MPIPVPTENENKRQYSERCMGDAKMVEEYPTTAQRYAVCMMEWKDSIKGK
jgi:hypothetical protein